MNKRQFNRVVAAQRLMEDAAIDFIIIAKNIQVKVLAAYKEVYPDKKYIDQDNCWLTGTDRIAINYDDPDDGIIAEFWEDGRCGNNDYCISTITITEELLSEQGCVDYANQWKQNELAKNDNAARAKETTRLCHIAELEAQLTKLRNAL